MTSADLELIPPGKIEISRIVQLGEGKKNSSLPGNQACLITFFDPERDPWIRKTYGMNGLRRHKLLRIMSEAYEQSFALNRETVSFDILGCGVRTLERDIQHFSRLGVWFPLQRVSHQSRRGRYTYKVAAVKFFLDGKTKPEIATCLYQHMDLIEKYVSDFSKLAKLAQCGLSNSHIKAVLKLPEALIDEFQELFNAYNTPQLFKKLDSLSKSAI